MFFTNQKKECEVPCNEVIIAKGDREDRRDFLYHSFTVAKAGANKPYNYI